MTSFNLVTISSPNLLFQPGDHHIIWSPFHYLLFQPGHHFIIQFPLPAQSHNLLFQPGDNLMIQSPITTWSPPHHPVSTFFLITIPSCNLLIQHGHLIIQPPHYANSSSTFIFLLFQSHHLPVIQQPLPAWSSHNWMVYQHVRYLMACSSVQSYL